MGKKKKSYLLLGVILAVVYTIISFVVPFVKLPTFYAAYVFGLIAIIMTIAVGILYGESKEIKSKFFKWAIIDVTVRYTIIQLVVSLIFMLISTIPLWIVIVTNILLLAVCCVGLIAGNVGKEEIEKIEQQIKAKVFYIREMQTEIEIITTKTEDILLKRKLQELVEQIRYSDPMSANQLVVLERKIEEKIYLLREKTEAAEVDNAMKLCEEIGELFVERNKKCLMLK